MSSTAVIQSSERSSRARFPRDVRAVTPGAGSLKTSPPAFLPVTLLPSWGISERALALQGAPFAALPATGHLLILALTRAPCTDFPLTAPRGLLAPRARVSSSSFRRPASIIVLAGGHISCRKSIFFFFSWRTSELSYVFTAT